MSFTGEVNPVTPILEKYRSSLMNIEQLQDVPDPEWLINGVLLKEAVAVLWGPSGGGKSFIAVDMALSIASGKATWFGHKVTPGKVLYVIGEGKSGMKQRINAWVKHYDLSPVDEELLVMGKMVDVIDPPSFEATKQIIAETQPDLVIIDTFARLMTGYNENDTTDMGRFVAAAEELRDDFNVAVLLVHHPTVTSGSAIQKMRGSGALKGAIDAEYELEYFPLDDPGSSRTLYCRKMKDAAPFRPMEIYLKPTGDSLVTSAFPGNIY